MNISMKNKLATVLLALVFVPTVFAQQVHSGAATGPDGDFVTEKGFKTKVFEVKNRDANTLASVLRQLGSGFKGATVTANSELRSLTVRDFPENLATMDEAINRLDTAAALAPNIELHMQVLIASNASGGTGGAQQAPSELKDVLAQLRGTFSYRNYEPIASIVQRLTETPRGLRGKGTAEISGAQPPAPAMVVPFEYFINSVSLARTATGAATVKIDEFSFSMISGRDISQVQTALNLRDGEKVVVGTATIKDRALIIVMTAKVLN
jgi:hypothetical protein